MNAPRFCVILGVSGVHGVGFGVAFRLKIDAFYKCILLLSGCYASVVPLASLSNPVSCLINMFWPAVLPFKITFWLLAILVLAATFIAPRLKWRKLRTFVYASLFASLGFVPSCIGVHYAVDAFRFGHFYHSSFSDVNDFRIERWLPPDATSISLFKHFSGNGYRARFTIDETDLVEYLDEIWQSHGKHSAILRHEFDDDGQETTDSYHDAQFQELGWVPAKNSIIYHSPVEGDGGGATYYYDRKSGIALQRAGYW